MKNDPPIQFSIVVPFFNEQENIPPLYMRLTEVMDGIGEPYELVFVDDGSKDNTFKVLSDIYEHDRRVNIVRLRRNFGQTAALKAGFDFARGEVIISMDGDLQHDPDEIPRFVEKIEEGYDLVSGWRHQRKDAWLTRQVPSRVANWMMAKLSGIELHDFGTTFKAYRREIIQEIQLYGELHRFIPALAGSSGAKIAEVPIENPHRKNGRSNYGIGRTIRVFLDLMIVKFLLDYSTRPLQFFGFLGICGASAGMAIAAYLGIDKLLHHTDAISEHGPLMLLAVVLFLSGVQLLSLGLLGEITSRTYYESQNKSIYALREVKSHRKETGDSAESSRASGSSER
ncbi:MAG: glycosyltransferase [Acidobacteria bacterium]|nr:MAG: glycosyltransferase [Acidobacteria bacterium 13_2_20CM_58_27]PYT75737.1 MAG: glycosyltransferase [Acidobacteriota bacterium]PYT89791.1 MAG: glycosyltransferase [Acidobacteriota bacterium]